MEARMEVAAHRGTMTKEFLELQKKAGEELPQEREWKIGTASYFLGMGTTAITPILPAAAVFGVKALTAASAGYYVGKKVKERELPTGQEVGYMFVGGLGGVSGAALWQPRTVSVELGKVKKTGEYSLIKSKVATKAGLRNMGLKLKH